MRIAIFYINTTSDISKLLQVISRAVRPVKFETILKYLEWYLCQISRTNHAIICLYCYPQKVCNFHMQVLQIKLKYHCSKPIKLQKCLMQQYNSTVANSQLTNSPWDQKSKISGTFFVMSIPFGLNLIVLLLELSRCRHHILILLLPLAV